MKWDTCTFAKWGNYRVKVMTWMGTSSERSEGKDQNLVNLRIHQCSLHLPMMTKFWSKKKVEKNLHVFRTSGVYVGDFVKEDSEVLGSFLPKWYCCGHQRWRLRSRRVQPDRGLRQEWKDEVRVRGMRKKKRIVQCSAECCHPPG